MFYILTGFLSGSVLFGYELPLLLKGVDVRSGSEDGNPGTFNAFVCGGFGCGAVTLLAELGKGFWPVAFCARKVGCESLLFALVMAAPVLGHAYSVFHHGNGGKAIAVSFGVLLGVLPLWIPLALLIAWYLFFSLLFPVKSHGRRTMAAFACFALTSLFLIRQRAVLLGNLLISGLVIHKHYMAIEASKNNNQGWELE